MNWIGRSSVTNEHPCHQLPPVVLWRPLPREVGHHRGPEDHQTPVVAYLVGPVLVGLTPRDPQEMLTVVGLSHRHSGTMGSQHDLLSLGTGPNQGDPTGGKSNGVIVSARVAKGVGSQATQTPTCQIMATRLIVPGIRPIMARKPMLTGAARDDVTIAVSPKEDEAEVLALADKGAKPSLCVCSAWIVRWRDIGPENPPGALGTLSSRGHEGAYGGEF